MSDEAGVRLAVESLRGQMRRLDTVVRMSAAEQRRINTELGEKINAQADRAETLGNRLDRLDNRLATYTGGMLAIWLLMQLATKFF